MSVRDFKGILMHWLLILQQLQI